MCIRIKILDVQLELVFWRRADLAITVRRDAPAAHVDAEIRAILTDLGADPQPAADPRYHCFCGEIIPHPAGLPALTTDHPTMELRYGA